MCRCYDRCIGVYNRCMGVYNRCIGVEIVTQGERNGERRERQAQIHRYRVQT